MVAQNYSESLVSALWKNRQSEKRKYKKDKLVEKFNYVREKNKSSDNNGCNCSQ